MRKKTPLLFYLLINILVSAITTLTVLWAWERAHTRPDLDARILDGSSVDLNGPTELISPETDRSDDNTEPTRVFAEQSTEVSIRAVVGAGNLEVEYVEIINQGDQPIDLSGWQLVNQREQVFTFPAMILNSDGAIKVLSKTGVNTVVELYWQADTPIWQTGETARLVDGSGEIMATYSIP